MAEIAVKEYKEGIFLQDKATIQGEIKLAESDLTRAADRVDWATRMYEKGYVSKAQKVSEELNFQKAKFTLEQSQSKLTCPRAVHQGQDDQGARERGRKVAVRRARQEADLPARDRQGSQAREADRQLQAAGPR